MSEQRKLKMRYFILSFSATFFVLSLMFLFLMSVVHPRTAAPAGTELAGYQAPYTPSEEDALTVLFIGVGDASSSGSFVLARFDPARGRVPVACFPAQTLVLNPAGKEETLAEAYAYGGVQYTREALARTLGIGIDRTVRINRNGFLAAAAAIGTVEFELPRDMEIEEGGLRVTLHQGRQLLDGKKIAGLMRCSDYEGGELERSEFIAALVCAVIDQRIDVALSTLSDQVFTAVINAVDTDISYTDYETRKQAAQFLAKLTDRPGQAVNISGRFDESGARLSLADTCIAAIVQSFS